MTGDFSTGLFGVSAASRPVIPGRIRAMSSPSPRRRGRPPKHGGAATMPSFATEPPVRQRIEELAAAEDMSLADIMTRLLAEGLGLPVPPYCQRRNQQELPLNKAS